MCRPHTFNANHIRISPKRTGQSRAEHESSARDESIGEDEIRVWQGSPAASLAVKKSTQGEHDEHQSIRINKAGARSATNLCEKDPDIGGHPNKTRDDPGDDRKFLSGGHLRDISGLRRCHVATWCRCCCRSSLDFSAVLRYGR